MARLARIVVPGRARHVTQRGNRREPSFFEEGDQAIYLALMAEQTAKHEAQLWTYG
jgi:putative transposase